MLAEGQKGTIAYLIKTSVGAKWLVILAGAAVRAGYEVHAFLPDEEGDLESRLVAIGVTVTKSPALAGNPLRALRSIPALRRALKSLDPDVVNYFLYRSALVARVATFGLRCTRVHSIAGPLFYESRMVRLLERLISRSDHHVFAGSEAVARATSAVGFPERRIHIVRFGADFAEFQPATAEMRQQARGALGLPASEPVFSMVAYWYAPKRLGLGGNDVKGHDTLLSAWEIYQRSGGSGHLLLTGAGLWKSGEAYRRESLEKLNAATLSTITVLGSVDDVRPSYYAADVSVSPSRSENYGAAVEASALGIPSIASNAGGLPEIVLPDTNGWIFPAGDAEALAQVLHESESVIRSGKATHYGDLARQHASELCDWSVINERYLLELGKLVG